VSELLLLADSHHRSPCVDGMPALCRAVGHRQVHAA
jgi:hypothetical protein